ncbi:hypothetical protein A2141_00585 [Candidatus Woesebacteria bacterium RBG_16_40_11]|nr:MAG: hypothetical protein A2141_00585 [Candidatus Woesebacteria bacterium RBG_16_40_11]
MGAKSAVAGKKVPTLENTIFPKMNIKFYSIESGRIQRKFTRHTIPSILKIPSGLLSAYFIFNKIQPDITLSFGGAVGFSISVASWLKKTPLVIHEQTVAVGFANKYSSLFARKIALARKESLNYFPVNKCVVVGNPISREVLSLKVRTSLHENKTIFITGGSRGSETINDTVKPILIKLLQKYYVIQQTGFSQFEEFKNIKQKLPDGLRQKIEVYPMIESWNWYKILDRADVIVSRSGANVVSELITLKKPAIYIPILFSYENEQFKNAKIAVDLGIAKIIEQDKLSPLLLYETIEDAFGNWDETISKMKTSELGDEKAAQKLVNLIENLC